MLSEFQKNNLFKLANFLEEKYNNLNFDMFYFMRSSSEDIGEGLYNLAHMPDECDTVACAAGHGPIAGIDIKSDETWIDYTRRVFINNNHRGFYFMFSSEWKDVDNTPLGAAARIRYLIDHENTIEKWNWKIDIFAFDYSAYHIKNRVKSIPDEVEIEPIRELEPA